MTTDTSGAPSDARCDDADIMRIWRECGLPDWFLGNGGTNHKLVAFAEALTAARPDTPSGAPSDEAQHIVSQWINSSGFRCWKLILSLLDSEELRLKADLAETLGDDEGIAEISSDLALVVSLRAALTAARFLGLAPILPSRHAGHRSGRVKTMRPEVADVANQIGAHMDEILHLFKPGAKITVIVRFPGLPGRDLIVSDDELEGVIACCRRRNGVLWQG